MTRHNVIEIVPTTRTLLERFYNHIPARTLISLTVLGDGEPVAIAGIYREQTWYVLFMDVVENIDIKKHKRNLIKCSRILVNRVNKLKLPVYSCADPEVEGSEVLLEHLGFEHAYGGVYRWPNSQAH